LRIKIPLHVSGIWIPFRANSYLETGSYGAGLNLDLYLEAEALNGPCQIYVGDTSVLRDQALEICSSTGSNITLRASSPFMLGSGFGISAGLLIAHALATYSSRRLPSLKALQAAHVAEVKYSTGLGDVLSEYTGGFAIRLKPGAPGVGIAHRVIVSDNPILVVGELSYREPTSVMLSRITNELYEEAFSYYRRIVESEDLQEFFKYSQAFTRRIFDYRMVDRLLTSHKGVVAYYLKKAALVVWVEKEYSSEVVELLGRHGIRALETRISSGGITIVHTT